jgi:hypothetical protein
MRIIFVQTRFMFSLSHLPVGGRSANTYGLCDAGQVKPVRSQMQARGLTIPGRHVTEYPVIGKEPSRKGKKKMGQSDPTALSR